MERPRLAAHVEKPDAGGGCHGWGKTGLTQGAAGGMSDGRGASGTEQAGTE